MITFEKVCIYPKEAAIITGKTPKTMRRMFCRIKENIGKKPHQFLTIKEFCAYCGLNDNEVREILNKQQSPQTEEQ